MGGLGVRNFMMGFCLRGWTRIRMAFHDVPNLLPRIHMPVHRRITVRGAGMLIPDSKNLVAVIFCLSESQTSTSFSGTVTRKVGLLPASGTLKAGVYSSLMTPSSYYLSGHLVCNHVLAAASSRTRASNARSF